MLRHVSTKKTRVNATLLVEKLFLFVVFHSFFTQMATPSKNPCSISNCKSTGIYNCQGCQRSFCKKHVAEHNMELSKEMDNVVYHHDLLQQQLTQQNVTLDDHPLMKEINDWQCECMKKIRDTAEKARQKLNELLTDNRQSLTQQLKVVSNQLKSSK